MAIIQANAHSRRIEVIDPENPGVPLFQQRGSAYVATCSCGWAGKQTARKSSAASAWGMHAAAQRRRTVRNQERGI